MTRVAVRPASRRLVALVAAGATWTAAAAAGAAPGEVAATGVPAPIPPADAAPAEAAPAAPPRVVAIIDATGDPDGAALAGRIGAALSADDGLAALADPPTARALVAALLDEDSAILGDARAALDQARDALSRFNDTTALAAAATGQTRLLAATPSATATRLLADLVFTEGLARFETDPAGATAAFAAVHRLDPDRALDPARYLPDVVAAYAQAARPGPATGAIAITVDGPATAVWLDGAAAGPPPVTAPVAPGIHFVMATGDDAVTTGARVTVGGARADLPLTAAPADQTIRLMRLRRRLLDAPDDTARAAAIATIARAVGTTAAVVVVRSGDGLGTRVWRDEAPGLGPVVAFTSGAAPRTVLEPLVRPRPPVDDHHVVIPPIKHPVAPPEPPWWQKGWVREVAAIGAIVLVGGVVTYAATRDPGSSTLEGPPTWKVP